MPLGTLLRTEVWPDATVITLPLKFIYTSPAEIFLNEILLFMELEQPQNNNSGSRNTAVESNHAFIALSNKF